jgi:hypothetical protein
LELDAMRADIEACQAQVNRMETTIRELRRHMGTLRSRAAAGKKRTAK